MGEFHNNLIHLSAFFEVIKGLWWCDNDAVLQTCHLESTFILSSSLFCTSLLCSSSLKFSLTFNEFLRSSKLILYFFESCLWIFAGLHFLSKNATRLLSIYIFLIFSNFVYLSLYQINLFQCEGCLDKS